MNTYAQNSEDLIIAQYFGDYKGTLLEVGANDGITFSNSKLLIELGWNAHLFEPGSVCGGLIILHQGNDNVHIYNTGIGEKEEVVKFWESGAHVPFGNDKGLVSTINKNEATKWPHVDFIEREIQLITFPLWWDYQGRPKLDFISIDCEGVDWLILRQINLINVGCKALIIEWNGLHDLFMLFSQYCYSAGMKLIHQNNENLIFVK